MKAWIREMFHRHFFIIALIIGVAAIIAGVVATDEDTPAQTGTDGHETQQEEPVEDSPPEPGDSGD